MFGDEESEDEIVGCSKEGGTEDWKKERGGDGDQQMKSDASPISFIRRATH